MELSGLHFAALYGAADVRIAAQVLVLVEPRLALLPVAAAVLRPSVVVLVPATALPIPIVVPAIPLATLVVIVAATALTALAVVVPAAWLPALVMIVLAISVATSIVVVVSAAPILTLAAAVVLTLVVAIVSTAALSRSRLHHADKAETYERCNPKRLHIGVLLVGSEERVESDLVRLGLSRIYETSGWRLGIAPTRSFLRKSCPTGRRMEKRTGA